MDVMVTSGAKDFSSSHTGAGAKDLHPPPRPSQASNRRFTWDWSSWDLTELIQDAGTESKGLA